MMHPMGAGPSTSIIEKEDSITGLNFVAWFFAQTQKDPNFYPLERSTITFFNVMNFKTINQRFSYQGGNEYLCKFRDELKRLFEGETVLRAGADHLVVISLNLTVEDIVNRVKELNLVMGHFEGGLRNQLKAGIYVADGTPQKPIVMMDRASLACREIHGMFNKEYAVFDDELNKKHEQQQYVLEHFEEAFEKGYFKVFYQPVVRALTGKVCGYEALARWIDPVRGIIPPFIFIEIFEKFHLIHRLDALIIEQACKDIRDDMDSGYAYEPVSVNLSRLDFELSDIKKIVDDAVAKYNIPKKYLNLEVTESAFSSQNTNLAETIKAFRADGYEVWLDDFGSGFSSFGNLQSYDFDLLKIDMSFLRTFDTNPKSKLIIASIVDMAKKLGIHTLAEGVETKEQYEYLKMIGCEIIQGYYFGKPMPVEEYQNNREKYCGYEVSEPSELKEYYDTIGTVNLLDNRPLIINRNTIVNFMPTALFELIDGKFQFIYTNKAFSDFMASIGARTHEQIISEFIDKFPEERAMLRQAMLDTEEQKIPIDCAMTIYSCKLIVAVKFLNRTGSRTSFVLTCRNLSKIKKPKYGHL
jgi:EAL domain-containing protein (putative c-di-GMP-specific phosphodiesterase class I)/GGDEF domain-containing protein